jgi:hypothetical protein
LERIALASVGHGFFKVARKVRQVVVRNDLAATRYSEGSLHETSDRLFARPNYQRLNVSRPKFKRLSHLALVSGAIINSGDASLVTRDVI